MQSKSCNLAAAYLHSLLAFIEGLRPLLSASGLHWWPLASNRPSAFFEGYCLYCRPSASIDFVWHIYGLFHLNGLRPWRKSHLSLTFYHSGLATLVQKSRGEIIISRSFFCNTQKTFENTEKKKFGFLMVIKTLKLEGKILFLTYILHSSWRTRDKISWEKNYFRGPDAASNEHILPFRDGV